MAEKEVMHLIGDFRPDVLERWLQWAALNNYTVVQLPGYQGIQGKSSPLMILDDHGLNDLPFPPTGTHP